MKKVWMTAFVFLVSGGILVPAFAYTEENQEMMGGGPGEEQGMRMGGGTKGKQMMGGMMGGMPSMVATSDGGVIVLAGNKLMKYSSQLTLLKEVELKMGKGSKPGGRGMPQEGAIEDMPEEGMPEEMLSEPQN